MKTGKKPPAGKIQKYLVLVPHKETRQILKKYSEELIKNGLKGVYPFPFVAPLSELERPLSAEELKKYALDLRLEMGNDKFTLCGNIISLASWRLCERIIGIFLSENDISIPPLEVSFRAAAVANFYIKPIPNGFKWKIGKLYWLPKK